MNTKLSYVEFLQQLNDPKSILYKLYDIKYNNCNIITDYYLFSTVTYKIELPSLTLTEWISEWSDICHHFTFRHKTVNNASAPYIYGDITMITFETREQREFKRTSLSAAELYALLACASAIKYHSLHSLVDDWLVDICCDPTVIDNIINKLTALTLEDATDDTIYVVEEFYE